MHQFDPEEITLFAKTDARGQEVPFGIKAKDRTRHVYIIGKTGMGKSTTLENMAVQDIRNGNGLAFIDPHGGTAEKLLDYVPEERINDVLYFAPFDTNCPVSFNVMEDVGPERRHLVVAGLMSVFKKIFVDQWSARMEYILSNTLLALLEYPDSTLLGVNRMLSDKVYRRKVIDNITDPAVKSFWVDEFLNYNERYMQEAGDAIKNKIGQFTANPIIRNIIGQPKSSFDIREIMDGQKILIMNLSKGLIGESNANLLGSMLTTRIYLAAMSRADLSHDQLDAMPNFYFYVDEFQSFANATFADILSEARKYKLNLTIAHQYITQMEEEVKDAVFGNVGTLISFRVGPFDAEVLETMFAPQFTATDIVNLGFAQIYLTLMIDGIGSQPFSANTLPPIKPAEVSYKDVVIDRSRKQFSKPKADVEKAINAWHEPMEGDKPNNDKGGNNSKGKGPSGGGYNSGGGSKGPGSGPRERSGGDFNKPRVDKKPAPPKGKSIDELRAVLKGISTSEKEKQNKIEESKKTTHQPGLKADSNNLRSALSAALGDAKDRSEDKKPVVENRNQTIENNEASEAKVQRQEETKKLETEGRSERKSESDQSGEKPVNKDQRTEPRNDRQPRNNKPDSSNKRSKERTNDRPNKKRPEQFEQKTQAQPDAKSEHKDDLRSALQSLNTDAKKTTQAPKDNNPDVSEKTPVREEKINEQPKQEVAKAENRATEPTTQEEKVVIQPPATAAEASVSRTDDPLAPNKLERMMRVNQSERSPLS